LVDTDKKLAFYKELKIAIFLIFQTALRCNLWSKITKFDENALFWASLNISELKIMKIHSNN